MGMSHFIASRNEISASLMLLQQVGQTTHLGCSRGDWNVASSSVKALEHERNY